MYYWIIDYPLIINYRITEYWLVGRSDNAKRRIVALDANWSGGTQSGEKRQQRQRSRKTDQRSTKASDNDDNNNDSISVLSHSTNNNNNNDNNNNDNNNWASMPSGYDDDWSSVDSLWEISPWTGTI